MNSLVLVWPEIVEALRDLFEDRAEPIYIVGGAVRDALRRQPIKDVDITVADHGIRVAKQIANGLHGDFFVLDAERDVGRALIDTPDGRLSIDVSSFRGESLEADLRDRDFTVNAMAVDLRGDLNQVIDPTGGMQDVLQKMIRRCNPESIAHDPIRMLRAVRQSVQFGFRIEPETLKDIRANTAHLLDTSIERVRDELFKLLALAKPVAGLRVADHLGLLTAIIPELAALHGLKQHPNHAYDGWNHTLAVVENLNDILATISDQRTDESAAQFSLGLVVMGMDRYRPQLQGHFNQMWPDERSHRALLLLTALLHDIGKPLVTPMLGADGYPRFRDHESVGAVAAEKRAEALHLSNGERERVVTLVRYHMGSALWKDNLTAIDIYRYWKPLGEAGIDLIVLTMADYLGAFGTRYSQDDWLKLIERAQILLKAYYEERERLVDPPVLINGNELMKALSLKPGPVIGELLENIREAQVSGEIVKAEDALRFAEKSAAEMGAETSAATSRRRNLGTRG